MTISPQCVLVTGAAGMVGRTVLDHLTDRGVAVTALVLTDPGDLPARRVVVGDAGDPAVVREALEGADAVIHLAAIPAPGMAPGVDVFSGNARATFAVLDEAGRAGVRRIAIASSYSVLGLAWAPRWLEPAYLPIDEDLPLQVEDPYALSKLADENTAAMIARLYDTMSITALRFPYIGHGKRLLDRATTLADDPSGGAAEMWSYLDTRDAARASWLALTVPGPGAHIVFVAAPQTVVPYPTEDLLDQYFPQVERRSPLPGRAVPLDLSKARNLLGFTAEHVLSFNEQPNTVAG